MAKGKKTGGRDFVKGQSGNPAGRTPLPPDLKAIKALKPTFVKNIIAKLGRMTQGELDFHLEDPATPMLELTIGKIYQKAFVSGDFMRMEFLLNRSIGKVKDDIDLNIKPQVKFKTTMTPDGRMMQDLIVAEFGEQAEEQDGES